MLIALSGTPGCGKTSVSKRLAKKLDFKLLTLNYFIKREKLYSGYDKKRKTYIADLKKIQKFVDKKIKNNYIIDSHMSHLLKVDKVIVLRCEPEELKKRLKRKGWSKKKILENIEAELIGIISSEARKKHKKVYDIDTTNKSINLIINKIIKLLKIKGNKPIDWLTCLK
jgi:adenylate kinase